MLVKTAASTGVPQSTGRRVCLPPLLLQHAMFLRACSPAVLHDACYEGEQGVSRPGSCNLTIQLD